MESSTKGKYVQLPRNTAYVVWLQGGFLKRGSRGTLTVTNMLYEARIFKTEHNAIQSATKKLAIYAPGSDFKVICLAEVFSRVYTSNGTSNGVQPMEFPKVVKVNHF